MDKLSKEIALEIEQLKQLIDTHRSLLIKCKSQPPSDIERSALAFFLHSFYSGLENILKRISKAIDGGLPKTEAWHRELLNSMAIAGESRGPVISKELYETLSEYLAFRHVVRQSYSFNLQWEKMAALVLNCEATMAAVEDQLRVFAEARQGPPD